MSIRVRFPRRSAIPVRRGEGRDCDKGGRDGLSRPVLLTPSARRSKCNMRGKRRLQVDFVR